MEVLLYTFKGTLYISMLIDFQRNSMWTGYNSGAGWQNQRTECDSWSLSFSQNGVGPGSKLVTFSNSPQCLTWECFPSQVWTLKTMAITFAWASWLFIVFWRLGG